MTKKIAVCGVQSGGKTTAVHGITAYLKTKGFSVAVVPEAARIAVRKGLKINLQSNIDTQLWIMCQHICNEVEANIDKPDYIICDRSVFDIVAYSHLIVDLSNIRFLTDLADMYNKYYAGYDLILFYGPLSKIEDDGVRDTSKSYQMMVEKQFKYVLDKCCVNIKTVSSTTKEERIKESIKYIEDLK